MSAARMEVKEAITRNIRALRDLGFEFQVIAVSDEDLQHFSLELAKIGLTVARLQLRVAHAAAEAI